MVADNVIELRPRGVTELFDQAFRLYRKNFVKYVGIIAVAEVPLQIVQMLVNLLIFLAFSNSTSESSSTSVIMTEAFGNSGINVIFLVLSYIFVSGLATAALTRAITSNYLGEEVTIGGAYHKIRGSWGSLLLALFLVGLISIVFLIWTIVPCVGWFTGLGMLFFLTLVITPLIAPVVVIERINATQAVRRGWDLARRRFWWLTGFFVLLLLFNLLVVQGPVQLVTLTIQSFLIQGASSANVASMTALQTISASLLSLVLSLLYIPLASTCAVLAYFDLRVRQEGFDLALMANQVGDTPVNALEFAGQPLSAPSGSLVTWKEMGNFVLVTLIFVGIYLVIVGLYAILLLLLYAGSIGY